MPSIDLRAVRFCYKNARQKTEALHGVDLSIADGEFVCVIGPSGCGKSTLLRLLAGLDMPDGGEISIGGQPVEGPGADRMIVFQDYALFPWLTAEKNISFALSRAKRVPRAEAKRTAAEYLQRVGMAQAADYYPCQLSGGMKQRVAIARALAMDTDILLLDEPFGALDAKIRASLQELLLELWTNDGGKKKTVVFVTHDINEALILADRIVYMQPGKIAGELRIDIPRPRRNVESSEEFGAYRRTLMRLFEGEDTEVAEL